jgi:hypothetical protein
MRSGKRPRRFVCYFLEFQYSGLGGIASNLLPKTRPQRKVGCSPLMLSRLELLFHCTFILFEIAQVVLGEDLLQSF